MHCSKHGCYSIHLVGAGEQRPQLARREFLQSD
jgi:hypothetical protein